MSDFFYIPGDTISANSTLLKGHGTYLKPNQNDLDNNHKSDVISKEQTVNSSLLGTSLLINKLLTVNPLYPLVYTPHIGDIIIGRVTALYNKKWKLECQSPLETTLHLSSINLPGASQRRKLEEDEIKMREYFGLNDLLVCEIQKVNINNVALQMRSEKCRKLCNGIIVCLPAMLVKRFKSQFIQIKDVDLIVGLNGICWIGNENRNDNTRISRIYIYLNSCKINNKIINEEELMNL
ncbi:Exosome complex component rrp4 [Conglomerata obtusa]